MEFQKTILCGDFSSMVGVSRLNYQRSIISNDVHTKWDLAKFQTIRQPIVVGSFSGWSTYPRVLDLPIKMPGSSYRIPTELSGLRTLIQQVIDYEESINYQNIDQYHCYLTVDQGWVDQFESQRRAGCHVDGFQGARITEKTVINRSYVCSDVLPTVFYPHQFLTSHLDDKVHNFFWNFDNQAQEDKSWKPEPNQIVLTDAYGVHRCAYAPVRMRRTFVRLSYDVRQFDRLGNTHNPAFEYDWEMVPRHTQKSLVQYG